MKKLFTILMTLMLLVLTQCKPNPEGGDEENVTKKVKVSCVISLSNDNRSDFSNLMNGKINWSDGRECVYVAIHGDNPQIIELESWADGNPSKLEFTGEAAENLITSGEQYDIWYFGHSQQLETPYINLNGEGNRLEGSIATQSGRLNDLGYCHIATTKVSATMVNGDVKLNLNGALDTKVAIAFLDLENVTELYGDAIVGTDYALQYNEETGRYEFNVMKDNNTKINVEGEDGISYVILLPNDNKETKIKCKKGDKTYAYTFHNYIKANKVYFRTASDGATAEPLKWEEIEEEPEQPGDSNSHEYVDLGLPSGLKWATCNVGASSPEEYGDYFAWGETTTKAEYTEDNCPIYGLSISELQSQGYIDGEGNLTAQYDAATANWGGEWRMPTYDELNELNTQCTWEWTTQNGVNGYKVTGPNGNSIFIPAAGDRRGSSLYYAGIYGYYWISTPYDYSDDGAYSLGFNSSSRGMSIYGRGRGRSVRPVYGGGVVEPEEPEAVAPVVTTAEVTEITSSSATCGGDVTTDNGSAVTARGICWSTSSNPTIEDNKTTDGSGIGSFTSQIPDLVPNTQYYVRAYATNAAGTSYGEQKSFTTLAKETNEINGHEYVDLGLPSGLLWATCNVGASSPEEYGDYFAWGEITTKAEYTEENSTTYGKQMNDISGNAQYDAATANWGGTWRMPTSEELEELVDECTWTWTTQNGVKGYKVRGRNGNSIFLSAAGEYYASSLGLVGKYGSYRSSSIGDNGYYDWAYFLTFSSDYYVNSNCNRCYGQSVRPVSGGNFEGPVEQPETHNGYTYVDLGLSVKWATCNVGATTPEEYGDYFAWGETTTKAEYNSSNCPTYGLSISELQSQGYIDSEGNLTAQYDAATANWGGTWRMPTSEELEELVDECTWTWTTQNGVNGYKVTGPSGANIFLPAAGYRNGSSLNTAGGYGFYWSSTPDGYYDDFSAYGLYFISSYLSMRDDGRIYGQSVRPVLE